MLGQIVLPDGVVDESAYDKLYLDINEKTSLSKCLPMDYYQQSFLENDDQTLVANWWVNITGKAQKEVLVICRFIIGTKLCFKQQTQVSVFSTMSSSSNPYIDDHVFVVDE